MMKPSEVNISNFNKSSFGLIMQYKCRLNKQCLTICLVIRSRGLVQGTYHDVLCLSYIRLHFYHNIWQNNSLNTAIASRKQIIIKLLHTETARCHDTAVSLHKQQRNFNFYNVREHALVCIYAGSKPLPRKHKQQRQ